MFALPPARARPERHLKAREASALPVGLIAALAARPVRLIDGAHPLSWWARWIGRRGLIVVRGDKIFWPDLPADLTGNPAQLALLAHELTHVWQYRNGLTLWRYLLRERGRYRYHLGPLKPFGDYGYEQQAAMVEDAVRLMHGLKPRYNLGARLSDLTELIPFMETPDGRA